MKDGRRRSKARWFYLAQLTRAHEDAMMDNLTKVWNSLGWKRWLLLINVVAVALILFFGENLLSWWNRLPLKEKVTTVIAPISSRFAEFETAERIFAEK